MPIDTQRNRAVWLAIGLVLAGCSVQLETPARVEAPVAASPAAPRSGQQRDELVDLGRKALREHRIHSPAGDNAIEYYVALRRRHPSPDAAVESALMELQPYAVIGAEQALGREEFDEAERLLRLIAAADPQAPALARIAQAIAAGRRR